MRPESELHTRYYIGAARCYPKADVGLSTWPITPLADGQAMELPWVLLGRKEPPGCNIVQLRVPEPFLGAAFSGLYLITVVVVSRILDVDCCAGLPVPLIPPLCHHLLCPVEADTVYVVVPYPVRGTFLRRLCTIACAICRGAIPLYEVTQVYTVSYNKIPT